MYLQYENSDEIIKELQTWEGFLYTICYDYDLLICNLPYYCKNDLKRSKFARNAQWLSMDK